MKRELDERVVAPTVTYEAGRYGMGTEEIHNLDIIEIKRLRKVCRATKMDRWRNEEVRHTVGVKENMSDRVTGRLRSVRTCGAYE